MPRVRRFKFAGCSVVIKVASNVRVAVSALVELAEAGVVRRGLVSVSTTESVLPAGLCSTSTAFGGEVSKSAGHCSINWVAGRINELRAGRSVNAITCGSMPVSVRV